MELTINIDETRFNELIKGELEKFSEQELHEICREGFMKCLSNEDTFKNLFVRPSNYYSSTNYSATDLLVQAAKKVDLDPLFADFQEQVRTYLREHHDDIIKGLMQDIFMNGFSNMLYHSELMNMIRGEFSAQMNDMRQQNDAKIYNAINSLH